MGKVMPDETDSGAAGSYQSFLRSGFLVFDMQHSQQLPEVAEPFFALGYTVDVTPCMTLEELQAGRRAAGGQ